MPPAPPTCARPSTSAPRRLGRRSVATLCAAAVALAPLGCGSDVEFYDADAPRVTHLSGTYYEMGVQHGRRHAADIRQVYTEFLSNALIPFFNRDQPEVAGVLPYYGQERFVEEFTFNFLLEAAQGLEPYIPQRFRDEIRGISDGSGVPYEQVLILNTIFDSILSLLNIQVLLRQIQAPVTREVAFPAALATDGIDNDEDGVVDEEGENLLTFPLRGSPVAALKGVPASATIRFEFDDRSLANLFDGDGINLDTTRVRVNDTLYLRNGSPSFRDNGDPFSPVVEVDVGPFPEGTPVTVDFELADLTADDVPPPAKPNVARLERVTYVVGAGDQPLGGFPNVKDPSAIGNVQAWTAGVTGSATADGATVVGRAMALLDIDVLHDFSRVLVYHPVADDGTPMPSYAVLGYTGIGWALTGMSSRGIVGAVNRCETFNDSTVGNVFKSEPYRLNPQGQLGPWMVREVLESAGSLDEAEAILRRAPSATGWNMFFADGPRDEMRVVELDSNLSGDADGGYHEILPEASADRRGSSLRGDDLRHATYFVKNADDGPPGVDLPLPFPLNLIFKLPLPDQAQWASTYFSSVSTFGTLGEALESGYGRIDADWFIDTMRRDDLHDDLISMHNAVLLPDTLEMYVAMGVLPAVDGEFNYFGPELFERPL